MIIVGNHIFLKYERYDYIIFRRNVNNLKIFLNIYFNLYNSLQTTYYVLLSLNYVQSVRSITVNTVFNFDTV